jgi:hypothetical protein
MTSALQSRHGPVARPGRGTCWNGWPGHALADIVARGARRVGARARCLPQASRLNTERAEPPEFAEKENGASRGAIPGIA